MTSASAMFRLSSASSGRKSSTFVRIFSAGKSIVSSISSQGRAPLGAYLKVPGRIVPTCGRITGTVMTAIILPPTAGSMNSISPVWGS